MTLISNPGRSIRMPWKPLVLGVLLTATALSLASCSNEPKETGKPFSLGGDSMVTGFTPTPTAAIRAVPKAEEGRGTPAPPPTGGGGQPPPTGGGLQIATAGNDLRFEKDKLTAKAGADFQVTLRNAASSRALQHNWVLVKAGTVDEVGAAGTAAGGGNGWIPKNNPNVLGFVDLTDGGQSKTGTIKALAPGTYGFVCTFPGHPSTMRGDLEVTP